MIGSIERISVSGAPTITFNFAGGAWHQEGK